MQQGLHLDLATVGAVNFSSTMVRASKSSTSDAKNAAVTAGAIQVQVITDAPGWKKSTT